MVVLIIVASILSFLSGIFVTINFAEREYWRGYNKGVDRRYERKQDDIQQPENVYRFRVITGGKSDDE